MRSTRSRCPGSYCGNDRIHRLTRTSRGRPSMALVSASSSSSWATSASSSSAANRSSPSRPVDTRTITSRLAVARCAHLLDAHEQALISRPVVRGTRKPLPSSGRCTDDAIEAPASRARPTRTSIRSSSVGGARARRDASALARGVGRQGDDDSVGIGVLDRAIGGLESQLDIVRRATSRRARRRARPCRRPARRTPDRRAAGGAARKPATRSRSRSGRGRELRRGGAHAEAVAVARVDAAEQGVDQPLEHRVAQLRAHERADRDVVVRGRGAVPPDGPPAGPSTMPDARTASRSVGTPSTSPAGSRRSAPSHHT